MKNSNLLLDDPIIRKNLIGFLSLRKPGPKLIFEEFNVHNGNAIADVVALYKYAHCFEIKSDKDKLERILQQSQYFDLSFSKLTLVTTEKFLDKAIDILPHYWGILIAKAWKTDVTFVYKRSAKPNPMWDPEKSLLSLWKSELINLGEKIECSDIKNRYSRALLAKNIARECKKERIKKGIYNAVYERYMDRILFKKQDYKKLQCVNHD